MLRRQRRSHFPSARGQPRRQAGGGLKLIRIHGLFIFSGRQTLDRDGISSVTSIVRYSATESSGADQLNPFVRMKRILSSSSSMAFSRHLVHGVSPSETTGITAAPVQYRTAHFYARTCHCHSRMSMLLHFQCDNPIRIWQQTRMAVRGVDSARFQYGIRKS